VLSLFLALCVASGFVTPVASATSGTAPTHNGATATIAPSILGLPSVNQITGLVGNTTFVLPPAPGIKWRYLSVQLTWPTFIAGGSLEAIDATNNDTRLATLTSPTDLTKTQNWLIPIDGKMGKTVTIVINSYIRETNYTANCGPNTTGVVIRAAPLSVGYVAQPIPLSVGSYLLGPINRLLLRVSTGFRYDVAGAATQVTAMTSANNVNRSLNAVLVSTDEPWSNLKAPSRFDRVVTFDPAAPAALTVNPDPRVGLVISGSGEGLARQVRLLGSRIAALLQTDSVRGLLVQGAAQNPGTTLTLEQLGINTQVVSGVGNFSIPLNFTQATVGYEFKGAILNLHGAAQAPPLGTAASLTLEINNIPVTSTKLQPNGSWSMTATLPWQEIQRSVNIAIVVSFFGYEGACAQLSPLAVSVDSSSVITLTPGAPLNANGFAAMPQLLLPAANVVIDPNFHDLQLAVQLVCGIQRTATVPLSLTAISPSSWDQASPAIIVARPTDELAKKLYPVTPINGTVIFTDNKGNGTIITDPNVSFLSIGHSSTQAGVVTLLENKGQGAQELINALNQQSNGWVSLAGDTAVVGPDGQLLTAFTVTPTLPKTTEVLVQWLQRPFVLFLLGAFAILFFLMLIPFLRRLLNRLRFWRSGPTEDPTDAKAAADDESDMHDPLADNEQASDPASPSDETASTEGDKAVEPSDAAQDAETSDAAQDAATSDESVGAPTDDATSTSEEASHVESPSQEDVTPAVDEPSTAADEAVPGPDDESSNSEASPSLSESPGTDAARGDQGDEPPVS